MKKNANEGTAMTSDGGSGRETASGRYGLGELTFDHIQKTCPDMKECLELARKVASCGQDVLILGQTGTGKTLVAQAIHNASPRRNGPFVEANIGGLPPQLLYAELFGSKAGAYTGAIDRPGRFQQADGGTLFLDEIGNLGAYAQQTLLKVAEQKEVTPLGGQDPRRYNIRLIAATNSDLERDVEQGRFRRDLYYQIARVVLRVPPLRERHRDIEELSKLFLERANRAFEPEVRVETISTACMERMHQHPWDGNIRELRFLIYSAMLFCTGDTLEVAHVFRERADEGPRSTHEAQPDGDWSLASVERSHILRTLEHTGGNYTRAAQLLGISRPTLYKRMDEYNLVRPPDHP